MRGSEKLIALIAVAIPLLVAVVGWRTISGWMAAPAAPAATPPPPLPATAVAAARAAQPTARPTVGVPATIRPNQSTQAPTATPGASVPPDARPAASTEPAVPPTAERSAGLAAAPSAADESNPGAAVSSFYALVSHHQFDSAAQLWSARMRTAFPPDANLNQRFSQTQDIRLNRADVVSQDQSRATVAVDLVELDASGEQRHFVGDWYLVRGPSGWLLDQPALRTAP